MPRRRISYTISVQIYFARCFCSPSHTQEEKVYICDMNNAE